MNPVGAARTLTEGSSRIESLLTQPLRAGLTSDVPTALREREAPRLPIQPQRVPIVRACRGICEPAERARLPEDWVWRVYLPYPTLTGWANFCRAYICKNLGILVHAI